MVPRLVLATSLALILAFSIVKGATADHRRILPGVPGTPAIQNLLADGDRAWCVNAAANNYPNFVSQLRQTYDSQRDKLGNTNRQIPGTFETPSAALAAGCEVLWVGRYDNFCAGCACNVYYGSWPVTVNVKLSLGYFDFRSCQGHEEGHVHGLGEFYIDQDGNIRCDTSYNAMIIRLGFPTIMSCGTFVWELQRADLDLICQIYGVGGQRFHGCAQQPPPCEPVGTTPCWLDGAGGFRWRFADGRSFAPDSGCGSWYSAKNTQEWGGCAYDWDGDSDLDGRYNEVIDDWVVAGTEGGFYHDETDEWFSLSLP